MLNAFLFTANVSLPFLLPKNYQYLKTGLNVISLGIALKQISAPFIQEVKRQMKLQQKRQIQKITIQLEDLQNFTETQKQLLQKLREQAKKMSDPKIFHEGKKKLEDLFISKISQIHIPQHKENKIKKKFIIGPISVGKSSLLKNFLDAEVEVGMGETTLSVNIVCRNEEVQIYDSPGVNQGFDITKFQILKELFEMDEFYICYNSSIKNVDLILRILSAIKIGSNNRKKIYLIRTQCDKFSVKDKRTLKQQLEIDNKYMEQLKENQRIPEIYQILATSSEKQLDFEDNQKLLQRFNPGGKKLEIVTQKKIMREIKQTQEIRKTNLRIQQ